MARPAAVFALWIRQQPGMEKPALVGAGEGQRALVSETKRRKVDAALRFLGSATTRRGDVGLHELAKR